MANSLDTARRDAVATVVRDMVTVNCAESEVDVEAVLRALDRHLDRLIEIVGRTRQGTLEPYLIQIMDEICSHCPNQLPCAFCPQRHTGQCYLFAHTQTLVGAISCVLDAAEEAPLEQWEIGAMD